MVELFGIEEPFFEITPFRINKTGTIINNKTKMVFEFSFIYLQNNIKDIAHNHDANDGYAKKHG